MANNQYLNRQHLNTSFKSQQNMGLYCSMLKQSFISDGTDHSRLRVLNIPRFSLTCSLWKTENVLV